jgi:hypothetical protein
MIKQFEEKGLFGWERKPDGSVKVLYMRTFEPFTRLLQEDGKENEELDGKEKRELGRLRTEKQNWNNSIDAAVHAGIFCKSAGRKIIRGELFDYLYEEGFGELPETTLERIWKSIPAEYKKGPGRPKNT